MENAETIEVSSDPSNRQLEGDADVDRAIEARLPEIAVVSATHRVLLSELRRTGNTGVTFKSLSHRHLLHIMLYNVAEREGFEPPVQQAGQRFSRPPRSAAPAPLRRRTTFPIRAVITWSYFLSGHRVVKPLSIDQLPPAVLAHTMAQATPRSRARSSTVRAVDS